MVEAELYIHAQPPTAKLGAGRNASVMAKFLRLTRETLRAWWARTKSFACFCQPVAKSIIGQVVAGQTLVPHDAGANTVRGRRGSLPTWTSLGARPIAALTELL